MLSIIRRAMKLNLHEGSVCVHVDDVKSAFGIGHTRIKSLGAALARYQVGSIDLAGTVNDEDEYHVILQEPSEYLTWADIVEFCDKSGRDLDDFVLRLKFDLLD